MGALPLFAVGLNFAIARFRLTLKEPYLPFLRLWRRSGLVPPSPRKGINPLDPYPEKRLRVFLIYYGFSITRGFQTQ